MKVPWFVPGEDTDKFCAWNSATRAAYIWRILTNEAINYGKIRYGFLELRYEDLIEDPYKVTNVCEKFLGLQRTKITLKNIMTVKNFIVTKHPDQINNIAIKERCFFKKIMKELNYL